MLLFNQEKVKKFFNILSEQSRHSLELYEGKCGKEVFTRRALSKLSGKFVKIFDSELGVTRYIYISSIKYSLRYNDDLRVNLVDYSKLQDKVTSEIWTHNEILYCEGIFCDGEEHKKLQELFEINLPERTFRFEVYDFDKFDESLSEEENMVEIKTHFDIKAMTIAEAFNKKKDFDKLAITSDYTIIN